MCRNITELRGLEPPATTEEIEAAARQYVRKVSGFIRPSSANAEAFEAAVAESCRRLLDRDGYRNQPRYDDRGVGRRRRPLDPGIERVRGVCRGIVISAFTHGVWRWTMSGERSHRFGFASCSGSIRTALKARTIDKRLTGGQYGLREIPGSSPRMTTGEVLGPLHVMFGLDPNIAQSTHNR